MHSIGVISSGGSLGAKHDADASAFLRAAISQNKLLALPVFVGTDLLCQQPPCCKGSLLAEPAHPIVN